MTHNPKFGPAAQTPEQRARVLEQMQKTILSLRAHTCTHTQQLFARYMAGELSWAEVIEARQRLATTTLP